MLLPLTWLKEFISTKASATEIAEKLTLSGSEVERILDNSHGLKDIVVGEIIEIKPHPDADKLRIAYVDVGKKDTLEIVCGAPNIAVGQKVPTVLLGGEVPGLKIEARKIRGVASQGMLASEQELGLSDDHSGILILSNDAKVGADVIELLELGDPVLELDITPNRPDCFSVVGLAREVGALYSSKLKVQSSKLKEDSGKASSKLSVSIKEKELCPMYTARVIEDVTIGPSPLWLQNRVRQMGIRSINNIVDVTNYVMMERGQPMHAFDADKIEGDVIIRQAKKGEIVEALDDEAYTLDSDMLVVADEKKAVAIAGVMGGKETGVTNETKTIVLEVALFNAVSVRKTSKTLGLRSESSSRFEKGVDASAIEEVLDYAASLMQEVSGGTVLKGIVSDGSVKTKTASITLAVSEVERLLGVVVPVSQIKSLLQSLGFVVTGSATKLKVTVPSWRMHDVFASADLIEEIGRLLDYNTLPKTLPLAPVRSPKREPMHEMRRSLSDYCIGAGFSEILTYSFYTKRAIELSGVAEKDHLLLTNPVNQEYPYMRASMMPWMLEKLSQNSALLSRDRFAMFELGRVFHKKEGERWQGVVGLIDVTATHEQLFRELRGIAEGYTNQPVIVEQKDGIYHLSINKKTIGSIIIFDKGSVPNMRFRSASAILLLELEVLITCLDDAQSTYTPLPYYPVIERDLGMVIPSVVTYTQVEEIITDFDPLIKKYELFDVYHGLDDGSSIAIRLTFNSTDRTLEAPEVDAIVAKLSSKLQKELNISFR